MDLVYENGVNLQQLKDDFVSYFKSFKEQFSSINNRIREFKLVFDEYSEYAKDKLMSIDVRLRDCSMYLGQIRDYLSKLTEWYYPQGNTAYPNQSDYHQMRTGWRNFFTSFAYKSFPDVLIDVHQQIEDKVNPLSPNNSEAFDSSINNIKDNTFIGSANEMVTTFPEQLKSSLSKDSSPVLQFKTVAVKNSYFSLPAKTYSIDFSFWAPFKGTADALISAFMYLGFLIILFKRLPEILHGAGVVRDNYNDFQEARDFNYNEYLNDPPETYQFNYYGQWREGE